jgi:hypothetical protein
MTVSAVYRVQVLRMGEPLIVGVFMAGNTCISRMYRIFQECGVHKQGDGSPVPFGCQGGILMAHEAILVTLGYQGSGEKSCK